MHHIETGSLPPAGCAWRQEAPPTANQPPLPVASKRRSDPCANRGHQKKKTRATDIRAFLPPLQHKRELPPGTEDCPRAQQPPKPHFNKSNSDSEHLLGHDPYG